MNAHTIAAAIKKRLASRWAEPESRAGVSLILGAGIGLAVGHVTLPHAEIIALIGTIMFLLPSNIAAPIVEAIEKESGVVVAAPAVVVPPPPTQGSP